MIVINFSRYMVVAMTSMVSASVLFAMPGAAQTSRPKVSAQSNADVMAFDLEGSFAQGGLIRGQIPPGTIRLSLDDSPLVWDDSGQFVMAFDRDALGHSRLEATLRDGRIVARDLAIARRAWSIQHVGTALRPTLQSADFLAIRTAELAKIAHARAQRSDSSGWKQAFIWPYAGRISGSFGEQRVYRGEPGAFHGGVDIAGPLGAPILAPADGVVVLASAAPFSLEGNLLILDHGAGLNSAFLHLSRIDVRQGDHVLRGQRIAAIGATGRATGPHLHWAMKWREARIDPQFVVAKTK